MFKNLKLGTKLITGFAIMALVALAIGLVGFLSIEKSSESLKDISGNCMPGVHTSVDDECTVGLTMSCTVGEDRRRR